jgi:hypothetical protein
MNKINIADLTFGKIFDMAIKESRDEFFAKLDPELDYTFELVSPFNKIVTPYPEPALYIIGVRDKTNEFKEVNVSEIYDDLPEYIKHPEFFSIKDPNGDFIGFEEMKMMANGLENPTDEGFVVVDYSSYNDEFGYYPRIKVKNGSYVALHHLRGTMDNGDLNYGSILEIVWKNEQDEVLANFPEFQPFFDEVMIKFANFDEGFSNDYTKLCDAGFFKMSMEERAIPENKKNFAMAVKDSKFKNFFFNMWNKGRTFKEDVENSCALHPKYFKKLWEEYISKF